MQNVPRKGLEMAMLMHLEELDIEANDEQRHPGGMEIASLVLQFYRTEKANGQTVTLKALLSIKMRQDAQDRYFKNWHETW